MSCRASVELMSLRLDGLLEPADITDLEQHIRTCRACTAQWTALREADRLLRVGARRPVQPPPDFAARVMTRVAATPVVRPQLWERERQQIQGGRHTVKLNSPTGITGHLVPVPVGVAAAAPPRTGLAGLLQHFHPLRNARMGVYLGGVSLAGVLSMLLLVLTSVLSSSGLAIDALPVGTVLSQAGNPTALQTWGLAVWGLVTTVLGQIDPWMITLATLVVGGLAAVWWRIVAAFARRAGNREVRA
jgi:putative zinc finger protein